MSRLTMTSDQGGVAFTFDLDITCKPSEAQKILRLAEKLKHYEDLEEAGRLIELPCKVGDTVWNVNEYAEGFKIRPMKACCIVVKGNNKKYVYLEYTDTNDYLEHGYGFDDFGYVLFLTKAEAEAKLAELKGGTDCKKATKSGYEWDLKDGRTVVLSIEVKGGGGDE